MTNPLAGKSTTRALLIAGIAIGPWFIVVSLLQAMTRPGFDLTKHEVSLLLVGAAGWVQTITFVVTGVLALAFAVGVRRQLHPEKAGTWGPILMAVFGILFIVTGLNHPDPQLGFPAGSPTGVPQIQSTPSNIHSIAFSALALCIVAFCFVFVRKFAADHARSWTISIAASAALIIAFVAFGGALMPTGHGGLPLLGAAIFITGSVSAIALRLERHQGAQQGTTRLIEQGESAARA